MSPRHAASPRIGRPASRDVVALVLVVAATAAAAIPFTHVFQTGALVRPLAIALLLPAAVAAAPLRSRPLTALAAVLAVLAPVVLAAPAHPATALRALWSGWAKILDSALLAPADAAHLPVAVGCVSLASAVAALLAVRTGSKLLPLLPALALFVVARALGTRAGTPAVLTDAVVLIAVAASFLYVRNEIAWRPTRATGAAAAAAGAAVVGVLVAQALPSPAPFDPSRLRPHTTAQIVETNPLVEVRAAQSQPARPAFRIDVDAPHLSSTTPLFVRLASLDGFDGTQWSAAGEFRSIGPTVPGGTGVGQPIITSVTSLGGTADPWVPMPLDAVTVQHAPRLLAYDETAQTLADPEGVRSGDTFRFRSVVRHLSDVALVTADADPGASAQLALPRGFPSALVSFATGNAGDGPAFIRASNLQRLFRTKYGYDPHAPAGDTLHDIATFLDPKTGGVGTSDQFAAAFVLLARADGIPARIGVGYETTPGSHVLTTRDLQAWPEVALAGLGWVPLTPERRSPGSAAAADQPRESAASEAADRVAGGTVSPAPVPPTTAPAGRRSGGLSTWVWVLLALLLSVVVVPGILVAVSVVRRRRRDARRRAGDARKQVAAAWRTAREALVVGGYGSAMSATPAEVVAVAQRKGFPVEGLVALRTLQHSLEAAMFRRADAFVPADVATAWAAVVQVEAAVAKQLSLRRRVVAAADPRTPSWAQQPADAISG